MEEDVGGGESWAVVAAPQDAHLAFYHTKVVLTLLKQKNNVVQCLPSEELLAADEKSQKNPTSIMMGVIFFFKKICYLVLLNVAAAMTARFFSLFMHPHYYR